MMEEEEFQERKWDTDGDISRSKLEEDCAARRNPEYRRRVLYMYTRC